MKTGLIFGKFLPLHEGHISLINFARKNCEILYIVVCYTKEEIIPGLVRTQWLKKTMEQDVDVILVSFEYDAKNLPNTSVSSKPISQLWSEAFKKLLPQIDIVFTSEGYGDYVAEFMGIQHILFDKHRRQTPISGSVIMKNPLKWWIYIADAAKSYFVKKISILGSESTGKSILTEQLAKHYKTVFVPEAGREIVEKTELCKLQDLDQVKTKHAENIIEQISIANKLLFIDTDLNITKSYASFLFNQELIVKSWEEEANKSDLYFFLELDCPFVQDGTRLNEDKRHALSISHKNMLIKNQVNYISISGMWQERFTKVCNIINSKYFS